MKKYIKEYIKNTEQLLKGKITQEDINNHLIKIQFFSHERLIHLLITLFFALISILFTILNLTFDNVLLFVVSIICYIMLLFYIVHYFFLENSVQYLYTLYDKMMKKVK